MCRSTVHGTPMMSTDLGAQVPLVLRPLLGCVAPGARRLNARPQQKPPAATRHPATLMPHATHSKDQKLSMLWQQMSTLALMLLLQQRQAHSLTAATCRGRQSAKQLAAARMDVWCK